MKNLLIYINPKEDFDKETSVLVKLQIENSLELGWPLKDLLLVTNFPYKYMGVRAFIIGGENYCKLFPQATKVDTTAYLFKMGFIGDNLYWLHDLDAYQQEVITEQELGLDNVDLGLTDYGRKPRWNGGSTFIKKTAGDIYQTLKDVMYAKNENYKTGIWKNEEDVLMEMTTKNTLNIKNRVKRLNYTYNFGVRKIALCYPTTIKPIKVLHFHPERIYWGKTRALDIIMYGKNELKIPIMNKRLTKLFKKYGIV